MDTLSTDQARTLLGGPVNGHDVLSGTANRRRMTLVTRPRHFWPRLFRGRRREPQPSRAPRPGREPARRDGTRLIAISAVLLTLLAAGLLSVSIAAQYAYFLAERHQVTASMIESAALDVGMLVFSLLALGLARKGLPARPERALIVACAATSAVMNYAPAHAGDWRSVLAWTMPPVFLAVVADRVIAVTRRHFLGMAEGRSAWRDGIGWTATAAKVAALGALYVLRVPLAPVSTGKGLRLAVLNATPLPQAPVVPALEASAAGAAAPAWASPDCVCPLPYAPGLPVPCAAAERCMRPALDTNTGGREARPRPGGGTGAARPGSKTERLLALVSRRHGDLADIPLDQVSRIATALAPEVDMHPASARTALLAAVRKALPAGEGDSE
jgi:hypothetical protein